MMKKEKKLVVEYCQKLLSRGLTRGTGGNISILDREKGRLAISGSGIDYDRMTAEDVVVMDLEGHILEGSVKPSTEYPLHLACYKKRQDISAVVHTHSIYCTTLACMRRGIEPVHYLLGFAGERVDCIPFYPIGSQELADHTAEALAERNGVLMGNHGFTAVGPSITYAFAAAEETEFVAEIYYRTLLAGGGQLLTSEEMAPMLAMAEGYIKK